MNESNTADTNRSGKFWQGFLLSVAGWILDIGLAAVIYSVGTYSEHFRIYTMLLVPIAAVLAVIWLPVAFIAGFSSLKKGFNASITLVAITTFIAPILVGCGFSLFFAWYG